MMSHAEGVAGVRPSTNFNKTPLVGSIVHPKAKFWPRGKPLLSQYELDFEYTYQHRLMPRPKRTSNSLIHQLLKCEKDAAARNTVCTLCPYLGCTSQDLDPEARQLAYERSRHFPLYLDLVVALEMDALAIAQEMALRLAISHWRPDISMDKVKHMIEIWPFEQTSSMTALSKADKKAAKKTPAPSFLDMISHHQDREQPPSSFGGRISQLRLFKCEEVADVNWKRAELEQQNIQRLVSAARSTEAHYYPRILARNEREWKVWLAFARTYIRAGESILKDTVQTVLDFGLPVEQQLQGRIVARPRGVIDAWMEAEMAGLRMGSRDFRESLVNKGWELP